MKRQFYLCLSSLSLLALIACEAPLDETKISQNPMSPLEFRDAQRAASICGRLAPDWGAIETSLRARGYVETTDPRLLEAQQRYKTVFLESAHSDVRVQLGAHRGEGACLVGADGMTPEQSFELAQPWVRAFDAKTNEERGQGLARNAVQAWGTIDEEGVVFIAAYKTWDVLDAKGAAARLLYVER